MSAIYNEIDGYAARWLRNLVDAGAITPGVVETRSIRDLRPEDVRDATQFHAVTIKCWVKGREFKGRYYTSLSATRGGVTRIGGDRSAAPTPTPAFGRDDGDLTDDLPF